MNFFSSAVFTVFKEIILRNSNQFEFFWYLPPLKRYIKNKYSFFNSAHHILDLFWHKFWLVYENRCIMGYNEDKLVLFFSPESWDNGQTRYENLTEIRGLLTVWHAFKLYQKNSKNVSKNRPAVKKGIIIISYQWLNPYPHGLSGKVTFASSQAYS